MELKRRYIIAVMALLAASVSLPAQKMVLENGIVVEGQWPPKLKMNYSPMDIPYMRTRPQTVSIDCGRQLLVDDYLIESSSLKRVAHQPVKYVANPILKPETPLEMGHNGNPGATAKDGGVWWDPQENIFKMWYEAGWLNVMAYATSTDGIHWEKPLVNEEKGDNSIVDEIPADSSTAWLDLFTDNDSERYKMFLRSPNSVPGSPVRYKTGWCMTSPDGINWDKRVETGPCGDRSTIFYNPFIGKWVYSIRNNGKVDNVSIGRYRCYLEAEDFLEGASWKKKDLAFWMGADSLDTPDPAIGDAPQLYNLSAVAYEGLMIALPQIHLGPSNKACAEKGTPKITELKVAYSRDGFHWDRRDREVFIRAEREPGFWDRGYVQSTGGLFNIVGDQLWFHYIGFSGKETMLSDELDFNGMHYGGSVGLAVLRRDGFVSHEASGTPGELVTCNVSFSGKYLFVNADCPQGRLKVEILDSAGTVIKAFKASRCKPFKGDSTIASIRWRGRSDLGELAGKPVKFRFILANGALYSFWVSPSKNGESNGFTAAGGPGFTGGRDTEGIRAYRKAENYMIELE